LPFGKHAGRTFPEVVIKDPDWFFASREQGHFKGKEAIEAEADEVHWKACAIRIPQAPGRRLVAEYTWFPGSTRLALVQLTPPTPPRTERSAQRPDSQSSTSAWRGGWDAAVTAKGTNFS
jgi:hypothetical protein